VNGEVAKQIKLPTAGLTRGLASTLDEWLTVDGSSWLAVRCYEERPDGRVRFAHTAPGREVPASRCVRERQRWSTGKAREEQ